MEPKVRGLEYIIYFFKKSTFYSIGCGHLVQSMLSKPLSFMRSNLLNVDLSVCDNVVLYRKFSLMPITSRLTPLSPERKQKLNTQASPGPNPYWV